MNKRIFLASALASILALPAFADNPVTIGSGAQCNVTNLGTSDNNSTANVEATWTANQYSENAGYYLSYDSTNGTLTPNVQCPVGSYCPGFSNQTFNDASIGLNACPATYTSAAGADAQSDCYIAGAATCSTVNPYTYGHGTATYGNATNGSSPCKTYYGSNTCTLDNANGCAITTLTCATGYHNGFRAGNVDIDPYEPGAGYKYLSKGTYKDRYSDSSYGNASSINIERGEWVVEFLSTGMLKGTAKCSATSSAYTIGSTTESDYIGTPSDDSGSYCWCHLDTFTPNGGSAISLSDSSWIKGASNSLNHCDYSCAATCEETFRHDTNTTTKRSAAYSSVFPRKCLANTINIDWYDGFTKLEVDASAQSCTYDSTITLPTTPTKPGYTFNGWQLQTTPARCGAITNQADYTSNQYCSWYGGTTCILNIGYCDTINNVPQSYCDNRDTGYGSNDNSYCNWWSNDDGTGLGSCSCCD